MDKEICNQAQSKELPDFENRRQAIVGLDYVPVEWVETLERYGKWKIVRVKNKYKFNYGERKIQ